MEEDLDVLLLLDHGVHLELELVGLDIEGAQGNVGILALVDAGFVQLVLSADVRIVLADVRIVGADVALGSVLLKTGEPLFEVAADKRIGTPVERGDKEDVAPGDVAAEEAVALHEDDGGVRVRSGGRNGGGMSGSAAADDKYVAFVVDGQLVCLFDVGLAHDRSPF